MVAGAVIKADETSVGNAGAWQGLTSLPGWPRPPASPRRLLGINARVHASRPWRMRHRLPHARGMGRRMLLLLLPRCAFGDGGTGKLIDRGIPAGALVHPIAAGINHPRHLPVAWNIFIVVPGVPLRLDRGRH